MLAARRPDRAFDEFFAPAAFPFFLSFLQINCPQKPSFLKQKSAKITALRPRPSPGGPAHGETFFSAAQRSAAPPLNASVFLSTTRKKPAGFLSSSLTTSPPHSKPENNIVPVRDSVPALPAFCLVGCPIPWPHTNSMDEALRPHLSLPTEDAALSRLPTSQISPNEPAVAQLLSTPSAGPFLTPSNPSPN